MLRGMVQSIAERAGGDTFLHRCLYDTLNNKLGAVNVLLLSNPLYSLVGLLIIYLLYLIIFFPLYLIALVFDSWLAAWVIFFIAFYYLARFIARFISFPGSSPMTSRQISNQNFVFILRLFLTAGEVGADYSNFLALVTSGRISSQLLRQKDKELDKLNHILATLPDLYTHLKDSFDYLNHASQSSSPSASSSSSSSKKQVGWVSRLFYSLSYSLYIPLTVFDKSYIPGSYISPDEEEPGSPSIYSPLREDGMTETSGSVNKERIIPYKPMLELTPSENRDLFVLLEALKEFISTFQQLFYHLQMSNDSSNAENKRNLLLIISQEASVKSENLLRVVKDIKNTLNMNSNEASQNTTSLSLSSVVSMLQPLFSFTQKMSHYERLIFPMFKSTLIRNFGARIIRIRPTEGFGELEGVYIAANDAKERNYGLNNKTFPALPQQLPDECSSKGIVMFFNPNAGFFECISQHDKNNSWFHYYLRENYDIFFFNYRQYSESWGLRSIDPVLIKNDSLLFCDFLLEKYPNVKIIAHGESIGGMSACYVSRMRGIPQSKDIPEKNNIGGISTLVCDRTFASLDATASRLMGEWAGIGVGILANWYTEVVSDYLSTTCRKVIFQDFKDEIVKDSSSLRQGVSYRILSNTFNNANIAEESLKDVFNYINSSNIFGFLSKINSHTKSNKFYLQTLELLDLNLSSESLEHGQFDSFSFDSSGHIENKHFFNSISTTSLMSFFTMALFSPYKLLTLKNLPLWIVPQENYNYIYSRYIDSALPYGHKMKNYIYSIANPYNPINDEVLAHFIASINRIFQLSTKEYHHDDTKSFNHTHSSGAYTKENNLRNRKSHESHGVLSTLSNVEKIRKLGTLAGENSANDNNKIFDGDAGEDDDGFNEDTSSNLSDGSHPCKHVPILTYQVITKIKMEDTFIEIKNDQGELRNYPLLPWTKVKVALLRTDGGFSRMITHSALRGLDNLRSWISDYIIWNKENSSNHVGHGMNECEGCVFYGIEQTIEDLEKLLTLNDSDCLFSSVSMFNNDEKREEFDHSFVFILSFLKALKLRRLFWLKSQEHQNSNSSLADIPKSYHLFRPDAPSPSPSSTPCFSTNSSPFILNSERLGELIVFSCGHNGWPNSSELSQVTKWLFSK